MVKKSELRAMSKNLIAEPDNYIHSFRKNLDMYIERKEITLAEVAEEADIPLATLKSFLYGNSKDCHLSTAVKLARVFSVSVDELVGCGTISPQTCESLQIVRTLPESFTHFVRWAIHYHYDMIHSYKVPMKSVEIMQAEVNEHGNMIMTNNMEIMDISFVDSELLPKIFIGIRIPSDLFEPLYFEGDILLIANDRNPRMSEHCIVGTPNAMWIVKRKEEMIDGKKCVNYYSIRDGKIRAPEIDARYVLGYVTYVHQNTEMEE